MKDKELEKLFKALSNKRRLAIIRFLKKNKVASVSDIASEIKLSFKSTSRHLSVLFAADIVDREQRSIQSLYSISASVSQFVKQILSVI